MPEVTWLLSKLTDPRSIIDILVVTIILFWVLWVAQGTRATQVLRGAIILLVLAYVLATTFSLTTLNWI
ncbi:MAG: TIGR00159 family protein, partial [Thermomicrobiales bacterium]|nr:TIGR00159 family protein [Thermomicrobiales bacterium]